VLYIRLGSAFELALELCIFTNEHAQFSEIRPIFRTKYRRDRIVVGLFIQFLVCTWTYISMVLLLKPCSAAIYCEFRVKNHIFFRFRFRYGMAKIGCQSENTDPLCFAGQLVASKESSVVLFFWRRPPDLRAWCADTGQHHVVLKEVGFRYEILFLMA